MAEKSEISNLLKQTASDASKLAKALGTKSVEVAKKVGTKSVEVTEETKAKIIEVVDQDGDGQIGVEDLVILGLKLPGVHVDRKTFLKKELSNKCLTDVVSVAIDKNPAVAGISMDIIDKVADDVIQSERLAVSGVSAALGAPGGLAMVATIPADITQYYGHLLKVAQKLLYLYGFPEIDIKQDGVALDSATMNTIVLCLGIMYGTAGANNALKAMAKALGLGVEKKLLNTALTKGTFYPLVKSIAKWFGAKMTKQIFAGFFKSAIPVLGGLLGGGITYASFKPCCNRLKESLKDTALSNPNHVSTQAEDMILGRIQEGVIVDVPEESIVAAESEMDNEFNA